MGIGYRGSGSVVLLDLFLVPVCVCGGVGVMYLFGERLKRSKIGQGELGARVILEGLKGRETKTLES